MKTLSLLLLGIPALAGTITYSDFANWNAAASLNGPVYVETFAGDQLHVPGLTITSTAKGPGPYTVSGNGHIQNGQWVDEVGRYTSTGAEEDMTVLTMSGREMHGFYTSALAVGGADSGLVLWLYDHGSPRGSVTIGGPVDDNGWQSGFSGPWGFDSDAGFDSVQFDGWSTDFTLGEMWIDPVPSVVPVATPEPGWYVAMGLLFLALPHRLVQKFTAAQNNL